MRRIRCYTVDVTKIGRNGEFRCPECGIEINPDDETEKVYAILETATREDRLESIVLQCYKCGSQIRLVGFDF